MVPSTRFRSGKNACGRSAIIGFSSLRSILALQILTLGCQSFSSRHFETFPYTTRPATEVPCPLRSTSVFSPVSKSRSSITQPANNGCPETTPLSSTQADRKRTRLNSSHANISYAVFCLKKAPQAPTSRALLDGAFWCPECGAHNLGSGRPFFLTIRRPPDTALFHARPHSR